MTTRSVLLINSDLAANRGDRAIAEGLIALVRQHFPGARLTILSQRPERDREWFGADVLEMDLQSLHPSDFLRFLLAVRRADVVLWGGGEFLKDYTNRAALWYWALKVGAASLANPYLYGAYQGIGPTSAPLSRRLVARIVNRTRLFVVRDPESREKALAWGADPARVITASDPAVLPDALEADADLRRRLLDEHGLDDGFLDEFVCIAPRDWFHYRPGGLLPFKYAARLPWRRQPTAADPRHDRYVDVLSDLLSEVASRHSNVLLVPMHMTENDADLCRLLRDRCDRPGGVRVLDQDSLSPGEFRAVIGMAQAMVGFRLHATIIATSVGVPSLNLYYVDKGRVYFDQIGQEHRAAPIEDVLDDGFVVALADRLDDLIARRSEVAAELRAATDRLRSDVVDAFGAIAEDAG